MTKKLRFSFLTLIGLIMFASITMGQVNMNSRIELTVTPGDLIMVALSNDSIYSQIKIESGDSVYYFIINESLHSGYYYADSSSLIIYGDVKVAQITYNSNLIKLDASNSIGLTTLRCGFNSNLSELKVNGLTNLNGLYCGGANLSSLNLTNLPSLNYLACEKNNLTTLDVSNLPNLKSLSCRRNNISNLNINGCDSLYSISCAGNKLTACALDSIFQSLPSRLIRGRITISDSLHSMYDSALFSNPGTSSCRDTIATNKNWLVLNEINHVTTNIINQNYACPYFTLPTVNVNMNRYIELNVIPGGQIAINVKADCANTEVKVVSGIYDTTLIVGTVEWIGRIYYPQDTIIRIYGNVKNFRSSVGTDLIGLDASHNTILTELDCSVNNISSLNVSGCVNLQQLACSYNNISSSLDVSQLDALTELYCSNNNIPSLVVKENGPLISINCENNNLSYLNINGLADLRSLWCYGNNLSTCALDSIFHQLPVTLIQYNSRIVIKNGEITTPGTSTCRDTIATNKNWHVIDWNDGDLLDIVNTNYACPYFNIGIEEIKAEDIVAKVYPNPVSNALNIETKEKVDNIILYDILGKEVLRTKKTNDIDVSNLNNGVYILKLMTEKGIRENKIVKE